MNNRKKNGFTLAELTVVLVLLAVLSVSIIGFVSVINLHITNYRVLLDVVDDLTYCKKAIVAWCSYFDNDSYETSIVNGELVARHKESGDGYRLSFTVLNPDKKSSKGLIVAQYDDGRTGSYESSNVMSITFSKSADGKFIKCILNYSSVGTGSAQNAVAERFDFVVACKTTVQ